MGRKSWYEEINGRFVVDLKVDSVEQLFDKRDPHPYRRKDLDDDVFEYIDSSVNEIGYKKVGMLRITTTDKLNIEVTDTIKKAIREFFLYRADISSKKLNTILVTGVKSLFVGITFLALATLTSSLVGKFIFEKYLRSFVKEGMILVGWVSMWMPTNIFLYEWWPLVGARKKFLAISDLDIVICELESDDSLIELVQGKKEKET